MAAKKGKPPIIPPQEENDDEFKFSDDDFGSAEGPGGGHEPPQKKPEKPKRGNFLKKISAKNLIMIVVILVGLISIYQFLTHKEKSAEPGQPQIAQRTTTQTTSKPRRVATTTPAASTTTVTSTLAPPQTGPVPVIQTSIMPGTGSQKPATVIQTETSPLPTEGAEVPSEGSQEVAVYAQQIKDLQGGLSQVGQSIVDLRSGLSSLTTQLKSLSSQMQIVACNPGAACGGTEPLLKAENAYTVKHVHKKPPAPLVYHVKAAIPGRAWLESNTGTSTSVKVGDTIKNYGTVTNINPSTGMVDTSSGTVIKLGKFDS